MINLEFKCKIQNDYSKLKNRHLERSAVLSYTYSLNVKLSLSLYAIS